jgi:hypothetical protein
MSTVRFIVSAAVATLAGVSLVACGSDADQATDSAPEQIEETTDDSNVVFDFTEQTARTMPTQGVKELTLKAPESLEQIDDDYREYKHTHDITVTATEPDEEFKQHDCAIQVQYNYTERAVEEAYNGDWYLEFPPGVYGEQDLQDFGITEADLDAQHRLLLEGDKIQDYVIGGRGSDAQQIQNEGFSTEVKNLHCATAPHDGDTTTVRLNYFNPDLMNGETRIQSNGQFFNETFASIDLRVMQNGDLHIAGYEINDYVVDANGEWLEQ